MKKSTSLSRTKPITDSIGRETRLYKVKGRVQGVWFRDSTRREADRLGISGYARNMSNGDVEVLAIGSPEALESLCRWLHHGPRMARVSEVVELPAEQQTLATFSIG